MSSVREHYEHLLAKHYLWMTGMPFEEKVREQQALLDQTMKKFGASISPGLALDLGSGPGFQSLALAQLGFSPVFAIDSGTELLKELTVRAGAHDIRTIEMDLTSLATLPVEEPATLALCMGDTLTHLPSRQIVQQLFIDVFARLSANGLFVITYRDLTIELTGTERFIPVRSDKEKVMICFLEFDNPESVLVHDIVHVQGADGAVLEKSCYRKLRLPQNWVSRELQNAGFHVVSEELNGRFDLLVARKQRVE